MRRFFLTLVIFLGLGVAYSGFVSAQAQPSSISSKKVVASTAPQDPPQEPSPQNPPPEDPAPAPAPEPIPPPGPEPNPAPIPAPVPEPEKPPAPQPEQKSKEEAKSTAPQDLPTESKVETAIPAALKNNAPENEHLSETTMVPVPIIDPHIKITKVHDFQNIDNYKPGKNDALQFEKDYWSYGAILNADIDRTHGQYFVITWVNKGDRSDFTTRFEYRQVNTKATIRTLTLNHRGIHGATRSTFAITGNAYRTYGPVYAWRFTIIKGDRVVAEDRSFIW